MNDLTAKFFEAFEWELAEGTLLITDYERLASKHNVLLPPSFIDWHKAFFFDEGDYFIARLPISLPDHPLEHLASQLEAGKYMALTQQGLYTFAEASNDAGPLVFDARQPVAGNEFPIREYEHDAGNYLGDLTGLSEIIFSSFSKMLECLTFFLNPPSGMDQDDLVRSFFDIDPMGAGGPGREYWTSRFIIS